MAVIIRMRRMGNNKRPFFRVLATDQRRKIEGRYLEVLGWYDPKLEGKNYLLKLDRIDYWIAKGAKLSDTVDSLVRRDRRGAKAAAAAAS